MPLHAIWFLKKGDQRPSEVLPFSRVEILGSSLVEFVDLLIEFVVHSFLVGTSDLVLDVIAVLPLIPGKVVELEEETSGPALARSPKAFLIEVALLELLPMLGEKAFEEVLPANGGLGSDDLVNIVIREVGKGERVVAPSVKAGE